ncbi:hypothetical protein pdam_00016800 [Pocillopora damicornis]|uniref:Uncharacterized protein n=1 Tax=Pocillopora damicornis TaxID=46731 RepID=A0A3M6TAX9_POCDA|nr:hypothetical protein pdam_00016800 [Pocillopora damicornis]
MPQELKFRLKKDALGKIQLDAMLLESLKASSKICKFSTIEQPEIRMSSRAAFPGNMSLSSLGNSCYEVSIEPAKTPLKGEGSCWFTFNPDLPSDITSGSAKFFGLGSIDLKGVKHTTNCFVGRRIPNADEEGWVTVEVFGKSDNTGKSSYLGQTQIYYYNNEKEVLKKIVQDEEQRRAFFESWKTACKGYSTDSREKETKSPSSGLIKIPFIGCMNSGNPLHSLQGLLLLVYAAAETDAREFIELVFNSSAGKMVFNAYRYNSPLPEDVARAFGYEDTAQYLESISNRLSEDLSANEECLKVRHILELAEAVKNQSSE